jgi:hypothetical protein
MPWYGTMMGLLLFVPGKSARVARAQFAQPAQNWVEGLAFAATERTKERIATRDRDALTLQSSAYPLNDLAAFDLIMPAREFFRGNLLDQQLFPRFLFTWRSRIWLATEHIADHFHKLALFFLILGVFAEGGKIRIIHKIAEWIRSCEGARDLRRRCIFTFILGHGSDPWLGLGRPRR